MQELRVLLLEDSPSDAKLVEAELRRTYATVTVTRVESADAMREALARSQFDLVISDWSMPQFSAPGALRILDESGLDLPFIIVSGTVGEDTAVEAMRAGAHDYVLKDKLVRLGAAVERELRDARVRQAARDAQGQLKLQEARFQLLIESSSDGITMTDRTGTLTYVSPATARIFGYDPAAIVGRSILEFLDEEDRPPVAEVMRTTRDRPGESARFVVRARRGDGARCWIEVRTTNLLEDPAVGAVVGNLRDITDERRMTEQLRESEERYRRIVETTGEGVWMTDARGTITFANERMAMIAGARAPLVGRNVVEIFGKDVLAPVPVDAEKGGHRQLETVIERADGTSLQCLVETSPLMTDEGRGGMLGMVMDVTALRTSERRLARVVEAGIVGICFADITGRIEDANDTCLRLMGYSREELVAGRISWQEMMPLEARADNDRISAVLAQSGVAEPFERDLLRKDGSRIHVLCGIAALEDGKRVVFIADLSAQKRAEAALHQTQAQLLQAQKLEAIGRLAGGVAHDFNNILTVILTLAECLAEEELPEALGADIAEILQAGRRGAELTKQLLMFSRQQVVEPVVFDVAELLAQMRKMMQRLLGEDVQLIVDVASGGCCIRADRGQIEQVVMNLVVNARDAMPGGGVLEIRSTALTLDEVQVQGFPGLAPGPYVTLTVHDTGQGMAPETLARVYEPFFTTKEKGKGTGLGLSTVFGIVNTCGGHIHVESAVGKGTTFQIFFPHSSEPPDQPTTAQPSRSLTGTETVLLVEDEESVRVITAGILRRAGYEVWVAENADAALRIAGERTIQALVTDVVMPRMSGPALAERVRAIQPGCAVLCMSGYIDDAVMRHDVIERGYGFLQKPITPEPLLQKLRAVLAAAHPAA